MRLLGRLFRRPGVASEIAWQDEQLRLLFNKMTELMEAATTNRDNADVTDLVGFLDNYIKTHFAEEERAMESLPYRAIAAHKDEHRAFVAEIDCIKAELDSNKWAIALSLRKKLAARLFDHICREDGTLETFFAHKGESHAAA